MQYKLLKTFSKKLKSKKNDKIVIRLHALCGIGIFDGVVGLYYLGINEGGEQQMTEKQLRDFIREKLGLSGWICWFAPRVKFLKQQDIFTMWDGVAARGPEIKFIQFTTKPNKSSHVKKISEFKKIYKLSHPGELWLWDNKTKDFEIINL